MKDVAVVALLTLSVVGCTLDDTEAAAERDTRPETSVDVAHAAEWVGTTTSGIEVTVRPDRIPVLVGLTEFEISFDRALPQEIPVSIDVISPEMPVMGLLRYVAEPTGPTTYRVAAEIRMDGAWEIYVNLGDGTDSAPFAFDVQPGDADGLDLTVRDSEAHRAHEIEEPETESHQFHNRR